MSDPKIPDERARTCRDDSADAWEHFVESGLDYHRTDLHGPALLDARFPPASFDLATGCMSLMDMPRPGDVLAAARAVLRPEGRVVFSVPQPVTDATSREWERGPDGRKKALKIDRYFEAAATLLEWKMKRLAEDHHFTTVQYRYTLEQWSRMIEAAGFCITAMREPRPTAEALARHPEMEDAARLPYFLIFELRPLG